MDEETNGILREKSRQQIIERLLWHLKNERNVLRWVVSRFLFYTGIGRMFVVNCGLYKIRFFPSAISLAKWLDPQYGNGDECFLRRILRPKDTVIDVGANIGTVSLAAASLVGEEGMVIAFEPNQRIFEYLKRNIQLNTFSNIRALNFAVGDRVGEVWLSDQESDDQNKILAHGGQKVEMTTVDKQVSPIQGRIRLLKVDVEGYEKFVFLGASKTLVRTDYIYFEVYEPHFSPFGYRTDDLLGMLRRYGFSTYRIDEGGNEVAVSANFVPGNCMNLLAKR